MIVQQIDQLYISCKKEKRKIKPIIYSKKVN